MRLFSDSQFGLGRSKEICFARVVQISFWLVGASAYLSHRGRGCFFWPSSHGAAVGFGAAVSSFFTDFIYKNSQMEIFQKISLKRCFGSSWKPVFQAPTSGSALSGTHGDPE